MSSEPQTLSTIHLESKLKALQEEESKIELFQYAPIFDENEDEVGKVRLIGPTHRNISFKLVSEAEMQQNINALTSKPED